MTWVGVAGNRFYAKVFVLMKLYPRLFLAGVSALACLASLSAKPLRVLYFTKASGFEHAPIKQVDGQPSYSEKVLTSLAAQHDLVLTCSKDGSLFSRDYLAQFDVIMFYTSGDLLSSGTDGQPAMTPAGKQALLDAIAGGKGFVAVHSGSDTFHTGEHGGGNPKLELRGARYVLNGDASDPYIRMLGGEFIKHGKQQVAKARVVDAAFPGFGEIGPVWELQEEWYTTKEFPPDVHVLLVMETAGMEGPDYQRPPYPLAWARNYGKGRVWANVMGHREDVWDSAKFQAMLIGGIEWAGGRKSAEIAPNLMAVTPQANAMQAAPPPEPAK